VERLEVRIDARTKRFLEDWARAEDISTSEAVRRLIQRQLGLEGGPENKQQAARQLMSIELTDVPEPAELEEEIHRALGA
jgi:hypothetical protein